MTTRAFLAAAAAAALVACAGGQKQQPAKSPQDQLADARAEQRAVFDRLYQAYGGSEVSGGTSSGPLGHVFGEADRGYFERSCLSYGRGQRPVNLSAKMQQFLDRPETQRECQHADALQRRIYDLSRRVTTG